MVSSFSEAVSMDLGLRDMSLGLYKSVVCGSLLGLLRPCSLLLLRREKAAAHTRQHAYLSEIKPLRSRSAETLLLVALHTFNMTNLADIESLLKRSDLTKLCKALAPC